MNCVRRYLSPNRRCLCVRQCSSSASRSMETPRSSSASRSLDDLFQAQLCGDSDHDDVVWDDTSEYEHIRDARSDSSRASEREEARHGASSRRTVESPCSDNTATTVTAIDNTQASSLSPSKLGGLTIDDDARLADLLSKCLRVNRGSSELVLDEHHILDDLDDDGAVDYDDEFEDDGTEPEEGEELPPSPQQHWLDDAVTVTVAPVPIVAPLSSSSSSSPLPSSSAPSSVKTPPPKQESATFSMEQFMKEAIRSSKKRTSMKPGISPSKVAQMTNRFRLHEERRARRLAAKRRDAETQQRLGFSYAPSIDRNSRRLTRHAPRFLERQHSFLTRKQENVKQEVDKQQQRHAGDRARELRANVRTPCICSRGTTAVSTQHGPEVPKPPRFDAGGLRSPSSIESPPQMEVPSVEMASPGAGHSEACRRFMAMCDKMNASFAIQRKKDRMRRTVDDMFAFQRDKEQRQKERAAKKAAQENSEATFTPRINPQSKRICAELVESGRLEPEVEQRLLRPRRATPIPPQLSFQPTISAKSKQLVRQRQKRASMVEPLTIRIRGPAAHASGSAHAKPVSPDVFMRLQVASVNPSDVMNDPSPLKSERAKTRASTRATSDSLQEVWTEVAFDATKHAFIVQGFELERIFALL